MLTNVPNLTGCSIILDRNLVIANRRVSWVHLKHIIDSNFNHIFRKNVQFQPTESMKAFNRTSACPKNDVIFPPWKVIDVKTYKKPFIISQMLQPLHFLHFGQGKHEISVYRDLCIWSFFLSQNTEISLFAMNFTYFFSSGSHLWFPSLGAIADLNFIL